MSPAAPAATTDVGRSPQELSGGQQALLGLALVLALASYHAPPLCLLDEVDAALDETNQVLIVALISVFRFRRGRVNAGGRRAMKQRALGGKLSYHNPYFTTSTRVRCPQAAAARLLAGRFNKAQAFCVSHHRDFHRQSDKIIAVEICDGVSRVRV